jgi:tetratricopeptide (TPR) repeat protein
MFAILVVSCQSDTSKKEASDFFLRGNAKFKEKEYFESIKWYTESIKKQKKFPDAYYNRGLVYQQLEKNDEALADFTIAYTQDPKFAPALFKLAETLQNLEKYDLAITESAKLIKNFPDSAANWTLHGNIQMQKEMWNESMVSYDRALAIDSLSVETMINQGVVFQELDQLDLAEKMFKRALKQGKYQDLIYNNLGYVEIQRMHWVLAKQYVQKALAVDPKNPLYVKNWERIQKKSMLE